MDTYNENQTYQEPTQKEADNSPDYRISLVRGTPEGQKDIWAELGPGWYHKDRKGITFTPDLLKIFGLKLVAREIDRS